MHRKDLIWIGVLLLLVLLWIWIDRPFEGGQTCHIILDGKDVASVPLDVDQVFVIEEGPHVVFRIKDGRAAFINSDCPDQVCVHTGFIGEAGQFAACLPNRVALRIEGSRAEDVLDTVAW